MKRFSFSLFLCLVLPLLSHAEEKKDRKTLVLQPGAKLSESGEQAAAAATPAAADNEDSPSQVAVAFFTSLQKGEVDQAYENLTKGSKIAERPDDMKALKDKTKEAINLFGNIQGSELLETKLVGKRLLRRTYISLGKEFPLRWRFYFYHTTSVWRLIDLRVDDRIQEMFDEPPEPK